MGMPNINHKETIMDEDIKTPNLYTENLCK